MWVPAQAEIYLPPSDAEAPLAFSADWASRWREGIYEVWWLRGNCRLQQGNRTATAEEAVLWIDPADAERSRPRKVLTYLEGRVILAQADSPSSERDTTTGGVRTVSHLAGQLKDRAWFGRFYTASAPQWQGELPNPPPASEPKIVVRGRNHFAPETASAPRVAQNPMGSPAGTEESSPRIRRLQIRPRSEVPVQLKSFQSPDGKQGIVAITSGVNLIVDFSHVELDVFGQSEPLSTLDIETDRLVIWTIPFQPDASGQFVQQEEVPLEIYLEGNIVFRQGERTVFAKRMYYDVRARRGLVLDAELITPVQGYEGWVRLKSDAIQQLDASRFVASNAWITTSRMGEPRYSLRSGMLTFEDQQFPAIDPRTGTIAVDPIDGRPQVGHRRLATSRNNVLQIGGVPVFYWPRLATDLEDPSYYVTSVRLGSDRVFGLQLGADFDAYQLFGVENKPPGTKWEIGADYLSDRGPALGTDFRYNRDGFLGLTGRNWGEIVAWGIHDDGFDNLGRGRRAVPLERDFRGRARWNHRHLLPSNWTLSAELGVISDRNFLEQYFEREWDQRKDQTTGFELKKLLDNQSFAISADARVNDFFTQTEWLPRLDHYWLGQSLFGDTVTWFEHTSVAYARLQPASAPSNPVDAAQTVPLPWQPDVEGERLVTSHEFDLPMEWGPVKVVPYVLGELAHWGQDIDGDRLDRFYYQAGTRASLPFWSVWPEAEDPLFDVHGLAHKVVLSAEFAFGEANRDLAQVPLYEPLNDNATQHFQQRFIPAMYGGNMPPLRFDHRFYALRTGMAGRVAAPSEEIADDLMAVRLGVHQRWQTKRGYPGARRTVDWVILDSNVSLFPKEDRDNFGETAGLVDYDFRWHVGDRVTLLSDGEFDFFADGLRTFTLGGSLNRPGRASLYLGFRSLEGPISANLINANLHYRMSPKWLGEFGSWVDLSDDSNFGQRLGLTRIGESFLVGISLNIDNNKDNVGVNFMVEPRFLPLSSRSRLDRLGVAPAGARGLE